MKRLEGAPEYNQRRGRFTFRRRTPHRWALLIAAGCLLGSVTLWGCRPAEPPADLVIINNVDPETLDPALATAIEDLRIVNALFEGLTRSDPRTARPVPGLAERWEISPDGRRYTFFLRTNLVWSTGDPISSEDVVYSWRRVLDPKTASDYAGQLYYVKNGEAYNRGKISDANQIGVHAMDPYRVLVELVNPTPFFLDLCAFQTLAVVPRKVIEKRGDGWLREVPLPVSGAYQLGHWRLNEKVRLRKNPFYWDAAHTRSEIVDLLPISTPSTALNLYERGVADIIWDKELVPSELWDDLRQRPDFHTFNYLGTYFLRFNTTRTPFSDARVRKALTLAVDKQRLVAKIRRTGEEVASHFVPTGTAHHRPAAGLGYDPNLARQYLAEAGFPDGKGFPVFQYLFDSAAGGAAKVHAKMGVELQEMWRRELGIRMELRQMEKKVYLAAQTSLDYDISRSSWVGDYNDANTFLDLFMSNNGNNRTGWKNSRYDALMTEANQQVDIAKRATLLQAAETILVRDEVPIIPLFFYIGFNYYNPARISGIYPNIIDLHPINAIGKAKPAWPARAGK